MRAVLSCIATH